MAKVWIKLGIAERLQYIKKVHDSIFRDSKRKQKFLYNNWHKHISIGLALGAVVAIILNITFSGVPFIAKTIICAVLTFIGCFTVEELQQGNRMIDEKERFESDKDLFVGFDSSLIAIIITLLLL